MTLISEHPVLLAVSAFVLGQLSMLLVLGLCTTASAEPTSPPLEHHAPPRRRGYRVHGAVG